MTTVKAHRFPVSIEWQEGRLTTASSPGKPDLEVATPPEFKGGIPGVWSPEDLLVGATAACYTVTLLAVAGRMGIDLVSLKVDGTGHIELGHDGRFGFIVIELLATLEVSADQHEAAESAARYAKDVCLVSRALDTPVHLEIHVVAREVATASA
jgi:organic hydroperoxide reductase OsmC/OhrA